MALAQTLILVTAKSGVASTQAASREGYARDHMTAYILRRLVATIPVMVVVAVFVFFLLRLAPGDPVAIIAGDDATAEQLGAVRGRLGLDRPILEQFALWVLGILQGDFGTSIFSNLPVSRMILQRLEPTLSLTLATLLVAVGLAIPLGVLAAWKAHRLVDRLVMGFAVLGFAMPVFLVGYLLTYVLAVKLGWLPVQGYRPLAEGLWPWAESLILPSLALGMTYMALIARITRASMLEVLAQDYIRTARAKGMRERIVIFRHALPNILVPLLTTIGVIFGTLLTATFVVETIFNIPGLGRQAIQAIFARDYPVTIAVLLLFTFFYAGINLVVDLLYGVIDPRIRLVVRR
jgi:peptide/nickel transport system permease protein